MHLDEGEDLKPIILALTSNNKHPISRAITAHLLAQNIQPVSVSNITTVTGNGIEGTFQNRVVRAGNPQWLNVNPDAITKDISQKGLSSFCVTVSGKLVAVFVLEDAIRPDAVATVEELKRRKIAISIISGDNDAAVQAVAQQLGIPASNVRSRCSPEDKQAYVKQQMEQEDSGCDGNHDHEHKHPHPHPHSHSPSHTHGPTVLFIGDGTNDAPSLAQASIGLHISEGGTDVASSAADAVLLRPSLSGIITLIELSKAFHRRVVFNFVWSAVYNLFAILLASGVFSAAKGRNVRIPPEYAGLGEVVSVVPVVGIAMALRFWKG
jgi:cation transport ATPase